MEAIDHRNLFVSNSNGICIVLKRYLPWIFSHHLFSFENDSLLIEYFFLENVWISLKENSEKKKTVWETWNAKLIQIFTGGNDDLKNDHTQSTFVLRDIQLTKDLVFSYAKCSKFHLIHYNNSLRFMLMYEWSRLKDFRI